MIEVPLKARDGSVRAVAVVDDRDAHLAARRWSFDGRYVVRSERTATGWRRLYLHREVLGLKPGDPQCDHEDRNPLNNRRSNLRLATHAQNQQNREFTRQRSGVRGVRYSHGRWQAVVQVNGETHNLGRFALDELDQARRVVEEFRAAHMAYSPEASRVNAQPGGSS